ncbi:haloacid dehalogenase superfamily, subfamily IA, variant 1 with third motif having Dx(3-4)D or Dx(3-4)E [Flaviramulus basaltis]|uniref:phosphoglycolate phosphatase n=1 Tax=Flaviramulus basaltis TaxID=369401 RepID=A0A1K2ICK3_9FLAO|nr:HAD-IA family hydrolase [Flaviramulus basaltis]SFZ90127.1 haloacid dehalogenase superfamily, subfamily IA, variant 1 with third motif having Dx(3-4)D or Dx(3-4)E [Flaviramulus basaltis]
MIKNILWDFDGVILDSMKVRDFGFREIFKDFSSNQVDNLIAFHRLNGGLSRYVKIQYFYETILEKPITQIEISSYANRFSKIMRDTLTDKKNLIKESVSFIDKNYKNYNFHIVSGSDQEELRFLCNELNLSDFFISIHGSPTAKNILVKELLNQEKYSLEETCLIGDSFNDYEAAKINKINFLAFNNPDLDKYNSIKPFY